MNKAGNDTSGPEHDAAFVSLLTVFMQALATIIPPGTDVVVRANPPAGTASSGDLSEALDPLWDRVIRRLGGSA